MRLIPALVVASLALAAPAAAPAVALDPGETVTPSFDHVLPNIPGKSLKAVTVDYAPGGASPGHTHAGSAFIFAYVVSGAIETQVEGEAPKVVKAGDSFYETPGAHHLISRNASKTEPARLLAVFVVDTDEHKLTTLDK
jgi:quercetin dioxygenase-like cupin family protein